MNELELKKIVSEVKSIRESIGAAPLDPNCKFQKILIENEIELQNFYQD